MTRMFKPKISLGLPQWVMAQVIASLVLACLALSFILCFYLSENFFFDKIWYKKSALHGYYNRWYYDTEAEHLNWLERELVRRREQDLTDLLAGKVWSKQPGFKTIAVIGDSYVYGVGIRQSQRFSERLVPELKKQGISAEVYAFAEPGNSILDYLALYQLVKQQLDPDLLILGIVPNDLFFTEDRYPGNRAFLESFDNACGDKPIYQSDNNYQDEAGFITAMQQSFSHNSRNRCYLVEAAKILGRDPQLIYYGFTARNTNFACHEWDATAELTIMNQYINTLESHGMRGLSHLKQDSPLQAMVSPKEGHPSSAINQQYAIELAHYIAKIDIND